MTDTTADFRSLLDRLRVGCPDAAKRLHDEYSPQIQRIVRRQMEQKLRAQFDSIDFLQQVWKSFFAGDLGGYDFDTPDALVAFLGRVAQNKVRDEVRRLHTLKRDVNRVAGAAPEGGDQFAAPQPTPSQEVMAEERLERLAAGQPETVRRVLGMLREGHTYAAVAAEVGVSEKFIQRVLHRLSKKVADR